MNATITLSFLVFLLYALLLPTAPEAMFTDPDTYWHLAAGDAIRALGHVPESDSWSLSAGAVRWYNISWGWDVIVSYAYAHGGWNGVIMLNAITVAATLALIFANCLIRSQSGISAFVAIMLVPFAIMNCSLRPMQCSELFIALMMLVLRPVSLRTVSPKWLAVIPLIMALWVNIHGGFVVCFFLLGVYALEALSLKDRKLCMALLVTGFASLLACMLNPYGVHIFTGVIQTMGTPAQTMIAEWQPLSFSAAHAAQIFYLLLFLMLVMMKDLPLSKAERWTNYSWLALGLHSVRHLAIFAVVSAPALALGLSKTLFASPAHSPKRLPWVERTATLLATLANKRKTSAIMSLVCLGVATLLFTAPVSQLYGTNSFNPLPDLSEEIFYLHQHPTRLLNAYNLGGPLVFLSHGVIPVFIDGRVNTAYPAKVVADYMAFHDQTRGWTSIFNRYNLDGVIVLSADNEFMGRFTDRKGWHQAFQGKVATVFLRDKP